ncbi:hypothetical protein C3E78_17135 [Aeromicrobium chenweiae]|uniref:Uncharacterized protein n=1 Tax=Aeromicrobium chenweiae TaxID=2079793 RepID=A0A2S0WR34_9ACTN|nr:hypothetical protein C3E78_17135 [Aeromicrobium chenweiae]
MRVLIGALGIGSCLWGLWLMRDFTREQLTSEATWFVGVVVLHDAVLAPVVVAVGYGASRLLPEPFRRPVATAFVVWGTLTVAFFPVLSGEGGKAGNETILGRPYGLSWVVMTLLLAAYAVVTGLLRRRRDPVATGAEGS